MPYPRQRWLRVLSACCQRLARAVDPRRKAETTTPVRSNPARMAPASSLWLLVFICAPLCDCHVIVGIACFDFSYGLIILRFSPTRIGETMDSDSIKKTAQKAAFAMSDDRVGYDK
jgi:hypothetical protein